jgi:putative DNA primase/helicase
MGIETDVHVPEELQKRDQWVGWRYELAPGRKKPMKAPYDLRLGQKVDINDPITWSSYELAVMNRGQFDGIGIVLTKEDDLVCVDIDDCIINGELNPLGREIIEQLDSYTEVSVSGRGVHVFCRADLGEFAGRRKGGVELYNYGRYIAVTGEHIVETPTRLVLRLHELRDLYRRHLMPERTSLEKSGRVYEQPLIQASDEEVLQRMYNDPKLGSLYFEIYHGDISNVLGGDESRADTLLFNGLAFFSYGDVDQVKRLLLNSPRAQQRGTKWFRKIRGQESYLDYQIADSIQYTQGK